MNPVPWTPRARTVVIVGSLALIALYTVGIMAGTLLDKTLWGNVYTAYCTTAFFATFFFTGFITGIASSERPYRNSLAVLLCCLSIFILGGREGLVCILMSIPVTLPEMLLGAWLGFRLRKWAWLSQQKSLGLIAAAFFISAIWEVAAATQNDPKQHPQHRIETVIEMAASPANVFTALQDIEVRKEPPAWLKIGLPIPLHMQVIEPRLGGEVRLTYANMTIRAAITRWIPGAELAFVPVHYEIRDRRFFHTRLGTVPGPKEDPVTDWMTFEEQSYSLRPLADGNTQVTRVSNFRRHLFPDLYFGWLEPLVIRHGQAHLLEGIRQRVEIPEAVAAAN